MVLCGVTCVCVCATSVDLYIPHDQELEVLMIVCETLEVSMKSACFGVENTCSKPGCHIVYIILYIICFLAHTVARRPMTVKRCKE